MLTLTGGGGGGKARIVASFPTSCEVALGVGCRISRRSVGPVLLLFIESARDGPTIEGSVATMADLANTSGWSTLTRRKKSRRTVIGGSVGVGEPDAEAVEVRDALPRRHSFFVRTRSTRDLKSFYADSDGFVLRNAQTQQRMLWLDLPQPDFLICFCPRCSFCS